VRHWRRQLPAEPLEEGRGDDALRPAAQAGRQGAGGALAPSAAARALEQEARKVSRAQVAPAVLHRALGVEVQEAHQLLADLRPRRVAVLQPVWQRRFVPESVPHYVMLTKRLTGR